MKYYFQREGPPGFRKLWRDYDAPTPRELLDRVDPLILEVTGPSRLAGPPFEVDVSGPIYKYMSWQIWEKRPDPHFSPILRLMYEAHRLDQKLHVRPPFRKPSYDFPKMQKDLHDRWLALRADVFGAVS